MIEEVAVVTSLENNQVRVQTGKSSACGQCVQQQSCSTGLLDKFMRKRDIVVDNDLSLSCGDKVVVGIEEGAFIKGSLLLYLLPLLALFAGAVAGDWLAKRWFATFVDPIAAVGAFTAFAICMLLIHKIQRRLVMSYFARPIVIRKLS